MVCQFLLYNKVNQLYVYIYPHIPSLLHLPPTLPIPPLQVDTNHRADLPVLCSCFPLAIYFTFGSVYMSVLLPHFVPACPSPHPPSPQVHSLCLRLYYYPAPRFPSWTQRFLHIDFSSHLLSKHVYSFGLNSSIRFSMIILEFLQAASDLNIILSYFIFHLNIQHISVFSYINFSVGLSVLPHDILLIQDSHRNSIMKVK